MANNYIGEVFFRPVGGDDNSWQSLGKCKALRMIDRKGNTISIGSVEDIFDLAQTDEDKTLLKEMKIGI